MAQVLIMGASIVYGVGGAHGGWADLIKLHLHERMYGEDGPAEAHEVHIFAKPDASVQFVADTYERQIADYRRENRKTVVVVSVGMNDTKAIETPDNFLNTPEVYKASMRDILKGLADKADAVLGVGFAPVGESKVRPKLNPFTGKNSYFSNERLRMFGAAFKEAADEAGANVHFVDLVSRVGDDWQNSCLSMDGLHPNDVGHRRVFEVVMGELEGLIG